MTDVINECDGNVFSIMQILDCQLKTDEFIIYKFSGAFKAIFWSGVSRFPGHLKSNLLFTYFRNCSLTIKI